MIPYNSLFVVRFDVNTFRFPSPSACVAFSSASMDAYEQVKVIGKGSFGVVTQIVRKSDGKVRRSVYCRCMSQ